MKVLQITAFSGWGCTGRIAFGIHNVISEQGHESAIAWGRTNTAPVDVKTIQIGSKYDQMLHGLYTRVTDKCGFGSKKVTKEFIKKVDEYNPDLIQLHIMHGYYINLEVLFNYIKEKEIPVVWTFHDCWAFTGHCPYFSYVECEKWRMGCNNCQQKKHHPTSWILDNSKWNYEKKREVFTGIKNMAVVTPSRWLSCLVRQSFLKEYPVITINNGINLNDFRPIQGRFRQDYDLEGKYVILGVSSTWVKSKGLHDFVELSKMLSDEYKIVLVGLSKEQKESLPTNIIGIERTDNIRSLAEIYTAADVFVNPTYEDNFPTTNIEAIACGTPVITYNTGGSPEAIDETCGIIVQKKDAKELFNAILDVRKNLFLKEDCIKRAKLFDQIKAYQSYLDFYKKFLQDNK